MREQTWTIGSNTSNIEAVSDAGANRGWDVLEILYSKALNGMFNKVDAQGKIISDEICNFLTNAGITVDPTNSSQMATVYNNLRNEIAEVVTKTFSFKGYVSTTEPSSSTYSLNTGDMWINSATMPATIPVSASNIKIWNGTSWANATENYSPMAFDTFSNLEDEEGYYWFGGEWKVVSTDLSLDYFTLNTTTGKWEIKSDVNLPGNPTTTTQPTSDNSTKLATTEFVKNVVSSSGGANVNLSNLSSTGKNIANWSTNVTNCITEIPQDIKLELNNGTITLKAGSKVYVPNGAGVFDTVTFASDLIITIGLGTYTKQIIIKGNSTFSVDKTAVFSGPTAPTSFGQYAIWYDTTNNFVKTTSDSGSTWESGWSLPIGIATVTSDVITSIDQVFNGFGYIGSTVFALPGVKGLIPNGRNEDDSLKSIEITLDDVITFTDSYQVDGILYYAIHENKTISNYFVNDLEYRKSKNLFYYNGNVIDNKIVVFAIYTSENGGKIKTFIPKTVFHAANDNDVVHKTGNETIYGIKFFMKNLYRINNNSDVSITPSSNVDTYFITSQDKNNKDMSFLLQTENSDGYTYFELVASKGVSGNRKLGRIGVRVDSAGNTVGYAPTPYPSAASREIATASFVKTYLQYVNVLPVNPDGNCFYAIPE